jgi:hypothetical protein
MSLKDKISKNSINSKLGKTIYPKFITDEVESLWSYYMTAFDYEMYYRETFKSFNGKTDTVVALKKLHYLLINNNIHDATGYNLIANTEEARLILSNVKIWIMYIISVYNDFELNELVGIFNNALQHDIDRIFLFEFFVIAISRLDSYKITLLKDIEIPSCIRSIYYSNRKQLLHIFDGNNSSLNSS